MPIDKYVSAHPGLVLAQRPCSPPAVGPGEAAPRGPRPRDGGTAARHHPCLVTTPQPAQEHTCQGLAAERVMVGERHRDVWSPPVPRRHRPAGLIESIPGRTSIAMNQPLLVTVQALERALSVTILLHLHRAKGTGIRLRSFHNEKHCEEKQKKNNRPGDIHKI